jgi:hypothetical protein
MSEVYYFQQSRIWESGNPVDPKSPVRSVKVRKGNAGRARQQLPPAGTGRIWVQIHPHQVEGGEQE